MKEHLIRRSGSVTYIGNLESSKFKPVMDHLVCFVPGMLALGSNVLERPDDLALARELAETCVMLYDEQPTGIAPEIVSFQGSPDAKYRIVSPKYYLRPETIESLFVLYRVTGDEQYRERAWRIFESIERHCKTDTAYSGLNDVTKVPAPLNNSMQRCVWAAFVFFLCFSMYPNALFVAAFSSPRHSSTFTSSLAPTLCCPCTSGCSTQRRTRCPFFPQGGNEEFLQVVEFNVFNSYVIARYTIHSALNMNGKSRGNMQGNTTFSGKSTYR